MISEPQTFKIQSNQKKPESRVVGFLTSRLFRIIISAGFLLYMFCKFDLGVIASNMVSANLDYFVYAVLIFIASGVLGALQWNIILGFHDINLKFSGTVSRYFMGLFFNFILPGFVGGDVIRIYKTAVVSGRATRAFSSTLADRVFGLLVLVIFCFVAFVFMPIGPAYRALPAAIIMFFSLVGFLCIFVFKPAGRFIHRFFGRFIPHGIVEKLRAIYMEMHELIRSPFTLLSVIVLSFFIQFLRIAVHYLCGIAIGIELGFSYFALFVPLMAIIASLPISIGGFGVREAFAVVLFSTVGIEEEIILSYAFLATFSAFIGSIPGGIAFALSAGETRKFE